MNQRSHFYRFRLAPGKRRVFSKIFKRKDLSPADPYQKVSYFFFIEKENVNWGVRTGDWRGKESIRNNQKGLKRKSLGRFFPGRRFIGNATYFHGRGDIFVRQGVGDNGRSPIIPQRPQHRSGCPASHPSQTPFPL
jgi:hypothetical protein